MRAGASRKSGPAPPQEPLFPSNFTELRAILDENVSPGSILNVMGLVKDCQLPIQTRGSGELNLSNGSRLVA